tara:strand:+ start:100 stop:354 length:255 start_codon:yes stop_codon:yes gene_type:complete
MLPDWYDDLFPEPRKPSAEDILQLIRSRQGKRWCKEGHTATAEQCKIIIQKMNKIKDSNSHGVRIGNICIPCDKWVIRFHDEFN